MNKEKFWELMTLLSLLLFMLVIFYSEKHSITRGITALGLFLLIVGSFAMFIGSPRQAKRKTVILNVNFTDGPGTMKVEVDSHINVEYLERLINLTIIDNRIDYSASHRYKDLFEQKMKNAENIKICNIRSNK